MSDVILFKSADTTKPRMKIQLVVIDTQNKTRMIHRGLLSTKSRVQAKNEETTGSIWTIHNTVHAAKQSQWRRTFGPQG